MSTEQADRTGGTTITTSRTTSRTTTSTTPGGQRPDERYAEDADVLQTRPRLRRDVLYTQVPDGVLFHDAGTGFRLQSPQAYRFACLVAPYLTGEYRVADLCGGLGESQSRMVVDLARSLLRRGFARDVVPADPSAPDLLGDDVRRRFAAQIGYVDHHVDDADSRFARFRRTRVAVLGSDEVARWCALSLVRNGSAEVGLDAAADPHGTVAAEAGLSLADGCAVDVRRLGDWSGDTGALSWTDLAGYDVVVVTPRARPRQLLTLTEAAPPRDTTLLPAWLLGDHLVVGPLTDAGADTCWRCALLRLGDNADPSSAAALWRSLLVPSATSALRTPSDPLAAMVGNLLGYEVFRLTTGALAAETRDAVLVQDLDSLDVTREPLLPHPHCPAHADRTATPAPVTGVPDLALPAGRHEPGQPAPEPGSPAVEADLARLEHRQVLVQPRAGVFPRFDDDALTQVPLRVSTVEVAPGDGPRRRVGAADLHHVLGARLTAIRAAAAVYASRQAGLPLRSGAPDAVYAVSLTTGHSTPVPAAQVQPLGHHNAESAALRTSAGLGIGDDPAQARGAALLSALAFRALDAALRGRVRVRQVRLDPAGQQPDDAALTFLARTAAGLGVGPGSAGPVELVELGDPAEQPVPVLLARCLDPNDGTSRWTVAADPSWRSAAVTALRDLLGGVQLAAELGHPVDAGDPLVGDLDARVLAVSGETDPQLSLTTTLPAALERLVAAGSDALVVDLPCPDLAAGGLHAARVLLHRTGRHAD